MAGFYFNLHFLESVQGSPRAFCGIYVSPVTHATLLYAGAIPNSVTEEVIDVLNHMHDCALLQIVINITCSAFH